MKRLLIICVVLFISTSIIYAQNKIIKGRVVDNNLEILPYVSIVINDTVKVGRTDLNGFFQIDIPISINKISFEYVGFDTATVRLINNCDEVELVMMLSGTYDFITLKQAERLRTKIFKELPELHRKAFDKGIFKNYNTCYTQELRPNYKKGKVILIVPACDSISHHLFLAVVSVITDYMHIRQFLITLTMAEPLSGREGLIKFPSWKGAPRPRGCRGGFCNRC